MNQKSGVMPVNLIMNVSVLETLSIDPFRMKTSLQAIEMYLNAQALPPNVALVIRVQKNTNVKLKE